MIFLQPDRDELRSKWRALTILGCLMIAAGEVALYSVTIGGPAAAVPLGVVLLAAGALLMHAPLHHPALGVLRLQNLAAAAHLAAGAWLIGSPPGSAAAVMPLLAACLIGCGAFQVHAAVTLQRPQWRLSVLSGSVIAMLGVLMLLAWPEGGVVALGRLAGLALMVGGVTLLGLAWSGWRSGRDDHAVRLNGR